jgi:hypothetical protein
MARRDALAERLTVLPTAEAGGPPRYLILDRRLPAPSCRRLRTSLVVRGANSSLTGASAAPVGLRRFLVDVLERVAHSRLDRYQHNGA